MFQSEPSASYSVLIGQFGWGAVLQGRHSSLSGNGCLTKRINRDSPPRRLPCAEKASTIQSALQPARLCAALSVALPQSSRATDNTVVTGNFALIMPDLSAIIQVKLSSRTLCYQSLP